MSVLQTQIEQQGSVNLRQKGTMHKGKIYKGSIQDAGSKYSIGSIPSTFQGIIYRSNSVQAFGSSCQRFESSLRSNMAPGTYMTDSNTFHKATFNKKGGGALLSKVQRKLYNVKQIPGPGKYTHLDSTMASIKDLNDADLRKSSSGKTQNKKQRSFVPRFADNENYVPGPGSYKTELRKSAMGCQSSFKSEIQRNKYGKNDNPGPGFYQYQLSPKSVSKKVKTQQPKIDYNQLLYKYISQEPKPTQTDYTIPDFQPKYFKIKNSPGFVHNGRDRFGYGQNQYKIEDKVLSDLPGPGAYEQKSIFDVEKQYATSSVFVNTTAREAFKDTNWKYGPNQKQIKLIGKKQFNINLESKWI